MRIEVAAHELATGEWLRIVKHRFAPEGLSEAEREGVSRACVVTGIHEVSLPCSSWRESCVRGGST